MSDDIASIRAGQKPFGVDVPRKITPDMPKTFEVPKPEASVSSGPMPSVGLGRTEKTSSLPGLPKPVAPSSLSRLGPTVGLGQAGKTGPLPPPAPQKPAEPFKTPEIQPSITVPSEKKGLSMTFYLLVAGILVIGGFLYWYLILRVTEPEIVVSPPPTETVTPPPIIRDLSNIFEGAPVNFEIASSESVSDDFGTFVDTLNVDIGDFLKINVVQNVEGTLVPLNWLDMFDMTPLPFTISPSGLRDSIEDSAMLVYGQAETFNEDGAVNFSAQDIKKTVFVARITDVAGAGTIMKDWELSMASDLADYLLIDDTSKEESVNFMDNTYRDVAIRYKNFPFPDVTVDYAIVKAAGQNYLIVTGSREAVYATIDVLLEQ